MNATIGYAEFFERYGGSLRTKHLNSPTAPDPDKTAQNKRPYVLPATSAAPPEYIRLDPWEAEYLFMVAARARLGIVETGRFKGGSVFLMAYANRDVPIHSIDLAPKNDKLLSALLTKARTGSNVDLIVGDSQTGSYPQIGAIDMLFVDGDHSYAGCLADLANWWPKLVVGGHVLVHDCYNGSPVMDAVIAFLGENEVLPMRSPYISREHWLSPAGSMMHFVKRG